MLLLHVNSFHRRAAHGKCCLSGLLKRPSRTAPLAAKAKAGVKRRHCKHCQEDDRPLQDHKRHLVIRNGPIETLLQLCNTVYRADEDEHNSRAECILEPSELLGVPQPDEADVPGASTRPA